MKDQTVLQAKRYEVFSCTPETPLLDAARQMNDEDISTLVVVDGEGYLCGVITRTDLLRALCATENWAEQHVTDFMSQQVVTVTPDTQLSHVADLLLDHQIHRVVVVQNERARRRPVAVVSAADLIYHMVEHA